MLIKTILSHAPGLAPIREDTPCENPANAGKGGLPNSTIRAKPSERSCFRSY